MVTNSVYEVLTIVLKITEALQAFTNYDIIVALTSVFNIKDIAKSFLSIVNENELKTECTQ